MILSCMLSCQDFYKKLLKAQAKSNNLCYTHHGFSVRLGDCICMQVPFSLVPLLDIFEFVENKA